jgi:hypothetical protein
MVCPHHELMEHIPKEKISFEKEKNSFEIFNRARETVTSN